MSQKVKRGLNQMSLKVDSKKQSSSSEDEDSNDESMKLDSNKFTTVQNIFNYFNFIEQSWGQKFKQHHPKLFKSFRQTELSKNFQNANAHETNKIFDKNQIFQQCVIQNKTLSFLLSYQQYHRKKLEQKILRSGRFRKVDSFRTELLIEEIHSSKHCQIINLEIQLLWYKTQILVLNNFKNCPLASMLQISDSGSFGTVYLLNTQNEELSIKSLTLQRKKKEEDYCEDLLNSSQIIIDGIKEYFFVLLLSQTEIGPKAKTIGGFDMILNKDRILFCTEICSAPQKEENQKLMKDLSESLFQMHMLQIVHRDIKPSNVMYSHTFGKHVFIDFGCSDGLQESLGQKKTTQFTGTTLYCGHQMLALLSSKLGEVDLYFNDIVSLEKTFKSQQLKILENRIVNEIESSTFLIFKMKFQLYSQKYEQFNETWKNVMQQYFSESEKIQVELLQFFKDLKINQRLRDFYWKEIDENIREMPEFRQLRILMQGKSFNLISEIVNFPCKQEQYTNFLKIYQQIKIQCSSFTREQTEISLILFSKQMITRYFQEIQTQLSKNYDFVEKSEAIKLSTVVTYYATFAENKYEASVQEKLKACNLAIKVLEKGGYINWGNQNPFSRFFQISVKQLWEVSYFYQVFWFKIWRNVPQNHRDKSALNSIITLQLISPPLIINTLLFCIYGDPNQLIQENHFTNVPKQNDKDKNIFKPQIFYERDEVIKIKRMCLFWQILLIHSIFKWSIFYIKQQSENQQEILKSIEEQIIKIQKIWIEDDLQNKALKMNKYYYNTLSTINQEFDKISFHQLFLELQSPQIIELQLKYSKLKKLKFLIKIVLSSMIGRQSVFYLRNQLINSNNETIHLQSYKNNIMIYQTVLFLTTGENFDKFATIFRKIQDIFNQKEIFFRFSLQILLRSSMKVNDRTVLQNVTRIIKTQLADLKVFAIENNQILIFILRTIWTVIEQQIKKSSAITQELINILSEYFQFVSFGWDIGYYYFFEKKPDSLILPKDDYSNIQLYHIILKDKALRSFMRVLVNLGKFYQKIILNSEYQQHKMIISQKHLKFINSEKIHRKLSLLTTKWLRILILNPELKIIIKQSFLILKIFVNLYFDEWRTLQQIQTASNIIDLLFQDLKPEDFSSTEKQKSLPPLDIAFDYYQIKLIKAQYGQKQCQDILKLYKISAKQNTFQTVFSKKSLLRFIFNAFIFAQRPFEEIFQYLLHLSSCVEKIGQNRIISIFLHELKFLFWCQCQMCFSRKPENWNPQKFTEYLYQKIKSLNPTQHPYMSLVFFHSMTQKKLETKIMQKFIIYALKSIKFIAPLARRDILKRIYFFSFKGFSSQATENTFFLILDKKGIIKSKISKSQRNNKNHRKFLHNYFMQTKHDESIKVSIQNLIEKGFCKEYYFYDYKYPEWVREIYKKKLRRFFEVKSNYLKKSSHQRYFEHERLVFL